MLHATWKPIWHSLFLTQTYACWSHKGFYRPISDNKGSMFYSARLLCKFAPTSPLVRSTFIINTKTREQNSSKETYRAIGLSYSNVHEDRSS